MKKNNQQSYKICPGVTLDEFSRKTIESLSGKQIAKRVAEQSKILDGMTAGAFDSKRIFK